MIALGQCVGEFEIVRLLGKGGMGEVYEARQSSPPRPVALKVLAPWLADSDEALERFWREAAVLAQLDHPAIVRIISTGRTADGLAYYTMHLVRGISLASLVRKSADSQPTTVAHAAGTPSGRAAVRSGSGRSSPPFALNPAGGDSLPGVVQEYRANRYAFVARVGAVAARALAHAHRQGVLHRDIKASNLMIDRHDHVYLVDFGLTRALDPGAAQSQPGAVRGTPWYMSPEQARGEDIDQRADLYALGVTLYELITQGVGPFTASRDNSAAVLAQVKAGQFMPLRTVNPAVPRPLEQIVTRAMQYKPGRRYACAEDMAAELEAFAQGVPPAPSRTKTGPSGGRGLFRPAWLAAAGIVLAVLVGVAVAHWLPGGSPDPDRRERAGEAGPARAEELEAHFRRPRELKTPLALLRTDLKPVRHLRLWGTGLLVPQDGNNGLLLNSGDEPRMVPTLIALDYVRDACFRFSAEVRQPITNDPNWPNNPVPSRNELGLFFGWPEKGSDPLARQRFFVVQLNEQPLRDWPRGRVIIGTGSLWKRQGAVGGGSEFIRGLPGPGALMPLPDRPGGPWHWHRLEVEVLNEEISVVVDDGPPGTFTVKGIKEATPRLKDQSLDPRGALGIWARNGRGYFRNVTVTALERVKK